MSTDLRRRTTTGIVLALLVTISACTSSATDDTATDDTAIALVPTSASSTTVEPSAPVVSTTPASSASSPTESTSAAPDITSAGEQVPSSVDTASGDVALVLPAPTGDLATGTTSIHLRDADRIDPLDPAGSRRELMVQLWYPTRATGGPLAAYAPPAEAEAAQQFYPVPPGAFTATTNSQLDVSVAPGVHDVVFFHPITACAHRVPIRPSSPNNSPASATSSSHWDRHARCRPSSSPTDGSSRPPTPSRVPPGLIRTRRPVRTR